MSNKQKYERTGYIKNLLVIVTLIIGAVLYYGDSDDVTRAEMNGAISSLESNVGVKLDSIDSKLDSKFLTLNSSLDSNFKILSDNVLSNTNDIQDLRADIK